ncbi:MAG: hypothetical protein ACOY46_17260 [Bacillota bacterium]
MDKKIKGGFLWDTGSGLIQITSLLKVNMVLAALSTVARDTILLPAHTAVKHSGLRAVRRRDQEPVRDRDSPRGGTKTGMREKNKEIMLRNYYQSIEKVTLVVTFSLISGIIITLAGTE